MKFNGKTYAAKEINDAIKAAGGDATLKEVLGERFIACGLKSGVVTIEGTPGNALGAYLDGAEIRVRGNGQDAVGDTMNDGKIVVFGSVGDTLGYAMRGGKIFVRDNVGYRAGVHIKEYGEKKPVIVIGGRAGCFLGEYMAGGLILVLNKENVKDPIDDYTGVGMYGGKILVRAHLLDTLLPKQIKCKRVEGQELAEFTPYIKEYAEEFGAEFAALTKGDFYLLTPDSSNPYKRLYTNN
ncbi:MAG: glutamate synthase [Clostridia bacterium]|nr:glutamate synthase [Clostridia bacterium]